MSKLNTNDSAAMRIFQSAENDRRSIALQLFERECETVGCESPIEVLFALAMRELMDVIGHKGFEFRMRPSSGWVARESIERNSNMQFVVFPQVKFGVHRVDFCVYALPPLGNSEPPTTVAVECDGKAFHHGDPERAAMDKKRDRAIVKSVDTVMRFTGSELNQDAYSCALEVFGYIVKWRM